MLDEFRRGYEVVKKVEQNKADWREVHEPFPFFNNGPFKRLGLKLNKPSRVTVSSEL